MKKCLYAIYDEKVKGIPGDIFTDFNDDTVKRGLQEQQKTKPISKEVASDLVLIRLGSLDFQSDLTNIAIYAEAVTVGKFTDFLTFIDNTSHSIS